jgi:VanZ family protein
LIKFINDRVNSRLAKFGFWIALLACTYLALAPSPPSSIAKVSDVVLHMCAFLFLTSALGFSYFKLAPWPTWIWMAVYGVALELVQSVIPQRVAELKDLGVDAAGICLGLVLLYLFKRLLPDSPAIDP